MNRPVIFRPAAAVLQAHRPPYRCRRSGAWSPRSRSVEVQAMRPDTRCTSRPPVPSWAAAGERSRQAGKRADGAGDVEHAAATLLANMRTPTGWVLDMWHYIDEETDGSFSPGSPTTCLDDVELLPGETDQHRFVIGDWWRRRGMTLKSGAMAATTAFASNGHAIVPSACVNAQSAARAAVRRSFLSVTSWRGRSAQSAPLMSTSA